MRLKRNEELIILMAWGYCDGSHGVIVAADSETMFCVRSRLVCYGLLIGFLCHDPNEPKSPLKESRDSHVAIAG